MPLKIIALPCMPLKFSNFPHCHKIFFALNAIMLAFPSTPCSFPLTMVRNSGSISLIMISLTLAVSKALLHLPHEVAALPLLAAARTRAVSCGELADQASVDLDDVIGQMRYCPGHSLPPFVSRGTLTLVSPAVPPHRTPPPVQVVHPALPAHRTQNFNQ